MSKLKISPHKNNFLIQNITPEKAGWEDLHFRVVNAEKDKVIEGNSENYEYVFVILSGKVKVNTDDGIDEIIGKRDSVFTGMPYALYISKETTYKITVVSDIAEIAYGFAKVKTKKASKVITPESATVEIRGGGNATRQINNIVPPGFDCERLVVVEVYTPSGSWSSYPPHKHDEHIVSESGELLEADLEEVYFYKIDKENGYAIQRVYNDDRSLDEVVVAENNDLVLVPEGYHPVVAAPGYNAYYLNFLVGSAQSLKATDDPDHKWVKECMGEKDPRLPIVK